MLPIKSKIKILIGFGALSTLGVGLQLIPGEVQAMDQPAENDIEIVQVSSFGGSTQVLFRRDGLTRSAIWDLGEYGIDLLSREQHNNELFQWQQGASVSFGIQSVACRHGNEFYLGGTDEAGDAIIERIAFSSPTGGLAARHPVETGGLGTSTDILDTEVYVVGGTFIPPKDREPLQVPGRKIVFREPGFGGIRSMSVDPEGRFLLVQEDSSGNVYQISSTGHKSLIVSGSSFLALEDGTLHNPVQFGTDERVMFIGKSGLFAEEYGWVLLQDSENDGLYDSPILISNEERNSFYPMETHGGTWEFTN